MRRPLTAVLSTLALAAVTALGAVPASGTPEPPPPLDHSLPGADAGSKTSQALRAADGPITAFVQLAVPSALDVVEEGGSTADAGAAAAAVAELAAEVVPQHGANLRSRSAAPQRLSVTSKLIAGTVVTGDAGEIRALADSDDVVAVHLVTLKTPSNKGTNSFTRAAEVWEAYGETGEGIRMGVIDTGLDYTHADFGGPGTDEAYAAAYGEDGTGPIPEGLFDGAKFLGGYDFAGPTYDPSGTVAGTTRVPQPDENPIDALYTGENSGHGTHVAGTAAGYGVTPDGETFRGDYGGLEDISDWQVGPGSAPEAGIYALKVFGDLGGSTGVTIDALEWAADPDGDFDFNDRLDIINLSLGASAAPVDDPENLFVDRLAELGTLAVMSAGNSGDATDVGGSPGNSRSALSVANSVGGTMTFDAVEVTAAADESLLGLHAMQNTVAYAGGEDAEGRVIYLGATVDGCDPLTPYAEQIAGEIVWLYWDDNDATRRCGSGARWANATAAGADGVLIGTEEPIFAAGIAGDAQTPGGQLTAAVTDLLLPEIQAGTLEVRVGPSYGDAQFVADPTVADTLNPGSSRGAHGSLGVVKPDVAAPGTSISSAASGTGTLAHTLTGTSMASPHVAGIAALVRAANPDWAPVEAKAAIMNTAVHDVLRDPGPSGPLFGPERAGAGRVDAFDAVTTGVIAYDSAAPDLVSVNFGIVDVGEETVVARRTITVENVASRGPVRFQPRFEASSTTGGATITTSPSSITVPPGRSQTVTVTLTADPTTLARDIDPTSDPDSGIGVPREFVAALSGRIVLAPRGEGDTLVVPVHAAPRLVSEVSAEPVVFPTADALTVPLELTGRPVDSGGWTSLVSVLDLVATSPQLEPTPGVGTSPTQVAAGDIRYVGMMSTAPQLEAAGEAPWLGYLGVGIAMAGEWPTLGTSTLPVIDTDLDGDGIPELQTVVEKYATEVDVTLAVTYDARTGQSVTLEAVNGSWGDTDSTVFDNNVLVAPIPLGLIRPGTVPTFTVWTASEYAPSGDGVLDSVEPVSYDPYAPDVWTTGGELNAMWSPTGTDLTIHRAPGVTDPGPLLVLHSHNALGARAQVVEVVVPEVESTPTTTALTVTGEPVVGSELTLTAAVAPGEAQGTVTFHDGEDELGSAPVEAGAASLTTPLGAGSHSLTAAFTPAAELWEASVSAPVIVDVAAAPSRTELRLGSRLGSYGTSTTAQVTVVADAATPSGTVEIRDGDQVVATGELVVDGATGQLTLDLPAELAAGTHRLTANYAGGGDVAASTSTVVSYTVRPLVSRVTIDAESQVPRGTAPEITIAVLGRGQAPVPTGSVEVYAGLRHVATAPLQADGTVDVHLPALSSLVVVSAIYTGDDGYLPGLDLTTIRVR